MISQDQTRQRAAIARRNAQTFITADLSQALVTNIQQRSSQSHQKPAGRSSKRGLRHFFSSTAGAITAVVLMIVGVAAIAYSVRSNLGASEGVEITRDRTFICSETLKSFQVTLEPGMTVPIDSPYSGKKTGYPAEACYWTKDGHATTTPYWVLLNSRVGKRGPTFCPDCGRLVVPRNPVAIEGNRPPPTEKEYRATHGLE